MVILMPEIDEIMVMADLGRREAMHFFNWYDDIPPSKRGDWRDRVKEWRSNHRGASVSAYMVNPGDALDRNFGID